MFWGPILRINFVILKIINNIQQESEMPQQQIARHHSSRSNGQTQIFLLLF